MTGETAGPRGNAKETSQRGRKFLSSSPHKYVLAPDGSSTVPATQDCGFVEPTTAPRRCPGRGVPRHTSLPKNPVTQSWNRLAARTGNNLAHEISSIPKRNGEKITGPTSVQGTALNFPVLGGGC